MKKNYYKDLFNEETPLAFTDGTEIYNDLKEEYLTHDKGYFIYGPSGVGKTYFIDNQIEKKWIDGDLIWCATKAFPTGDWWNRSSEEIKTIELRADVITRQALKQGFWIIGASSVNVIPDAIVIPDFETHLKYIKYRETHNYDGGIKSDDLNLIKENREFFSRFQKDGVPVFKSVEEAAAFLERKDALMENINNKSYKISQLKYTLYHWMSGMITNGCPITTSIEIKPEMLKDSWRVSIVHKYMLENDYEEKTITKEFVLDNHQEVIEKLEKIDLRSLKNNYFSDEMPKKFTHWEVEYNYYFKIAGTFDQELDEIKQIKNILNLEKYINEMLKTVQKEIKNNFN